MLQARLAKRIKDKSDKSDNTDHFRQADGQDAILEVRFGLVRYHVSG